MLQGVLGAEALVGIEGQEQRDEVRHVLVKSVEDVVEARGLGKEHVDGSVVFRLVALFEEPAVAQEVSFGVASGRSHPGGHAAEDALHPGQHLGAGAVVEEDVADGELDQNASNAPDVNLVVVVAAENDFRGPIGPTLDHVRRPAVVVEEGRAEVDQLDLAGGVGLHQDIFRLEVGVDEREAVHVGHGREHLGGDLLEPRWRKVGRVVPGELVQVGA